jgi:hypothetical protein
VRTPDLIDALAQSATPVRRLRAPHLRAAMWLAFAGLVIALIVLGHGVQSGLAERVHHPDFVITTVAALVTGVLSAVAAFAVSVPGRSRWWLALPMPALALWMSTIGYGCIADWVSVPPQGIRFGEELGCFSLLLLTSVPLAIVLAIMLRHAAMLRAGVVAVMGGLAIAAITAAALSLFHNHDATVLILIWNLGTAALITGTGGMAGGHLFRWMAARVQTPGMAL